MSIKPVQNQFNGGEISPLMAGRFDLPIYQYAAQKLINNIPVSEGCYKRRGGTHFVSEAKAQEPLLFKINVTPDDAEVVIDGAITKEAYLAYGDEIDYKITADGYSTVYGKYQIKENTELNIYMVSLVQRANFKIIPTPADAEVIINGVKRTEANIGVNGKVSYSVSKEGYETKQGEFIITKDTTLEIKIDCSFEVVCLDFSDATILINGVEQTKISVIPPQTVSWEVRRGDLVKTGETLVDKSKKEYVLLDEDGEVFNYTGEVQTYVVPSMVDEIEVDCVGAAGLGGTNGGYGGRVQAKVQVTAGEVLYVYVGREPTGRITAEYNASDIRTVAGAVTGENQLRSRILVAGGGGCSGAGNGVGKGGNGGGLTGANGGDVGCCGGGQGGRQTTGGDAGRDIPWTSQNTKPGGKGVLGLGGNGVSNSGVGGAGGSGYYGGGGGRGGYTKSYGNNGGGGGGGSSYTAASRCSNVIHTQGYVNASRNGYVSIKPIFWGV